MRKLLSICLIFICLISVSACSKEEIVDGYNQVLQDIGESNLTSDKELQGERKFGEDSYVGSYEADYKEYSGEEKIFGGTALERDSGNEISIECNIRMEDGKIRLLLQTGDSDPKVLFETSGNYSDTLELPSASNYITIQADNFTGTIDLNIK